MKNSYFFTCVVAAFTAVYTISGFHMAVNANTISMLGSFEKKWSWCKIKYRNITSVQKLKLFPVFRLLAFEKPQLEQG